MRISWSIVMRHFTITAELTLILAKARSDLPARAILGEVLRIRPKAWPNLLIIEMGDALLFRNGEMVTATVEVYRTQLEIRPNLGEFMTHGGRGRDIAAARGMRTL